MSAFNQEGQIVGTQINRTGGVNFGNGSNIKIKGDVIGRDKTSPKYYLLVCNINETGISEGIDLYFGTRDEVIDSFCERYRYNREEHDWHLDCIRYMDDFEVAIGEVKSGKSL